MLNWMLFFFPQLGDSGQVAYVAPQFTLTRLNVATLDIARQHIGTKTIARQNVGTLEVGR